jgi:HSP20 family protein
MAELVRRERLEWPGIARRFFDVDWEMSPIRVEEYIDGDAMVVKAEMPGMDPDKDVEISIADGLLHIQAERHEEAAHQGKDGFRSEFRYGSFFRDIPLPAGAKESDVKAAYRDGVLTVRVPVPKRNAPPAKIPVTRS